MNGLENQMWIPFFLTVKSRVYRLSHPYLTRIADHHFCPDICSIFASQRVCIAGREP